MGSPGEGPGGRGGALRLLCELEGVIGGGVRGVGAPDPTSRHLLEDDNTGYVQDTGGDAAPPSLSDSGVFEGEQGVPQDQQRPQQVKGHEVTSSLEEGEYQVLEDLTYEHLHWPDRSSYLEYTTSRLQEEFTSPGQQHQDGRHLEGDFQRRGSLNHEYVNLMFPTQYSGQGGYSSSRRGTQSPVSGDSALPLSQADDDEDDDDDDEDTLYQTDPNGSSASTPIATTPTGCYVDVDQPWRRHADHTPMSSCSGVEDWASVSSTMDPTSTAPPSRPLTSELPPGATTFDPGVVLRRQPDRGCRSRCGVPGVGVAGKHLGVRWADQAYFHQAMELICCGLVKGVDVLWEKKLQVNGQDLSQSSHDEAVEAFRTAKEPIVVEVLRRVSKSSTTSSTSSSTSKMKQHTPAPTVPMVSTASQTDDYLDDMAYYGFYGDEEDPEAEIYAFNGNGSLVNPASRQAVAFSPDLGLTDIEMTNGLDYDDQYIDEMEYEEVTLTRKHPSEKIGLTLCYGSAVADITDVFVSEIEPNGVAGRSGRIHEGDQILQINGLDVHSREQAIRLFAENRTDLSLLLSRPQLVQMDDGFMDEQNILDELPMEMLEQHACCQSDYSPNLLTQGHDEEGGTTDTATTENSSNKQEKDSGVGRTDESTRNDESSEQEIMENECTSPSSSAKFPGACKLGSEDLHYSNDSFTSTEAHEHEVRGANEISAEECKKFREVLETRCSSVENSPRRAPPTVNGTGSPAVNGTANGTTTVNGTCDGADGHSDGSGGGGVGAKNGQGGGDLTRKDSQGSIEREIAMLNKEMEMIQIECQEIVEAHSRERQRIHPDSGGAGGGGGGGGTGGGAGGAGLSGIRTEPYRSPRMVPRMGTRLDYTKQAMAAPEGGSDPVWVRHEHMSPLAKEALRLKSKRLPSEEQLKDKDTSTTSAYNTGDSCRSTPLTLELNAGGEASKNSLLSLAHPKPSHSDSEKMTQTQTVPLPKKEWSSDGDAKKRLAKSTSNGSMTEKMSQTQLAMSEEKMESLQELYAQYADVMYTNRANLEHTIMVQQKLFQQQLEQRTYGSVPDPPTPNRAPGEAGGGAGAPGIPLVQPVLPNQAEVPGGASSSGGQMEWVVKRRADGSRYITRRPVRNKILKERSRKIAEERCGMTTDDDAQSEMKIGRYWTREDRKRHLEKARDHKRRKEQMIKQRMETLKENEVEGKKEPNIVDLSHRKMMRHKGKKVFDDFTTVQEMLAHGSREHQGKTYNPLLSVTTV